MFINAIAPLAIGIALNAWGTMLLKRQKGTILPVPYWLCKNVKKEDVVAHARLMGIAFLIMGVASCITSGLLMVFKVERGWPYLVYFFGVVAGSVVIYVGQRKYNKEERS